MNRARCVELLNEVYPHVNFWIDGNIRKGGVGLPGLVDDDEAIRLLCERKAQFQQKIDKIDQFLIIGRYE